LKDKGYDKNDIKKAVKKEVKMLEEDYYHKGKKSCSKYYNKKDCYDFSRGCKWDKKAGVCYFKRSFEDEDFSLDSSEDLFDSEDYDMDFYEDEDSEDYDFNELSDSSSDLMTK
jgi:hypothetical protein